MRNGSSANITSPSQGLLQVKGSEVQCMDGMLFGNSGIGGLGIWVFGTASILCAVSRSFDLRTKQVLLHNVIHFILARNSDNTSNHKHCGEGEGGDEACMMHVHASQQQRKPIISQTFQLQTHLYTTASILCSALLCCSCDNGTRLGED